MFSRLLQPYGFIRRLPITERQQFQPHHTLRYAELLQELGDQKSTDPVRRALLLQEKAHIEELAGRHREALDALEEARAGLPASSSDALARELPYSLAKTHYRGGDLVRSQSLLDALIGDRSTPAVLRARALLYVGRIALEQGRFSVAVEALTEGLARDQTPGNLVSGNLDLVCAHILRPDLAAAETVLAHVKTLFDPADGMSHGALLYYEAWVETVRGNRKAALAGFQAALEGLRHGSIRDAVPCCELAIGVIHLRTGRLLECAHACDRAREACTPLSRTDIVLHVELLRARAYLVMGRNAEALAVYERLEQKATLALQPQITSRALEGQAETLTLQGKAAEAERAMQRSLDLRRTTGDRLGESMDLNSLARVLRRAKAFPGAAAASQAAKAIAEEIGNRFELGRSELETMEVLAATGDLEGALAAGERGGAHFKALGRMPRLARAYQDQARVLALRDRFEEALALVDRAAEVVREDPCPLFLAEVLLVRAEVLGDRCDVGHCDSDEAQRALTQARDLVEGTGCDPLLDHLQRSLDELREREFARRLLERYMDRKVVYQLLARPERRQADSLHQEATILFSDIRGYTTLSEQLGPGEVVALLNEHFEAMTEEVLRCGGAIDKFMGDAIMAVFGDPGHPRPDDATRAVRAGIAMVRRRDAMNVERAARQLPPIRIGVGIHCGNVVMGNIGSRYRVSYTVVGDAVNVASRLESETKVHGKAILTSEAVVSRIGQAISTQLVGELHLKGREVRVKVYAVDL